MSGNVLTLAGRTPAQLGIRFAQSSQRPGLPGTRDRTQDIPGRNGALDFGADMQPRFFSLSCTVLAANAAEMQILVEQLARLLVNHYGKPRTVQLVYADHPDRTYNVRYSGSLPIERMAGFGRFTLPLVAFEPYAHGPEHVIEQPITESPETIEVQVGGNIRTEPVIVLTNQGTETITHFVIVNEYRVE